MTNQTIIPPARPQRQMMIKNLAPRLPERGHIKIGMKGEMITSQRGNQFQPPEKLDHFRVTTLERGRDGNFLLDTAFHAKYGERPTEIPVRLLYDDTALNYPTRYACFIGRTLWCTGDGETASRLTEAPQDLKTAGRIAPREVACPCHRQEAGYAGQDKCKMNGSLSVLIEGMGGVGGVWRFRTTSYNSIVGILSSMAFLRSVTSGVLANIPLVLRVQPKQTTNPQNPAQSVTIYVVSLEFAGDISELQQIGHQIAFDRATTHISIANIEEEARRVLMIEGPANAVLPGDNADEVVEEFYPEQATEMETAPPRPTREQFAAPQAPEHTAKTNDQPQLSETEHAELAALIVAGDAAAVAGPEEFTKFWNDPATKPYRPELAEHLDAWADAAAAATESDPLPFAFTDPDGEIHEHADPEAVTISFAEHLDAAAKDRGEDGINGLWESNGRLLSVLREAGHEGFADRLSQQCGELLDQARAEAAKAAQQQAPARSEPERSGGAIHEFAAQAPQADPIRGNDAAGRPIAETVSHAGKAEAQLRSGAVPPTQAGAKPATAPESGGVSRATTDAGQASSTAGRGRTATTDASRSEPAHTGGDLLSAGKRTPPPKAPLGLGVPKRSPIWHEKSFETPKYPNETWAAYGAEMVFKIGEATVPEIERFLKDNEAHLNTMRLKDGDAYWAVSEAAKRRRDELTEARR